MRVLASVISEFADGFESTHKKKHSVSFEPLFRPLHLTVVTRSGTQLDVLQYMFLNTLTFELVVMRIKLKSPVWMMNRWSNMLLKLHWVSM